MKLHADDLFNDQAFRALGYATFGAADIGEVTSTMSRITRTDAVQWHDEWRATADRVAASAEKSDRAGARSAWLRASNYYRTAGIFLMGSPVDPRLVETSHLQTSTFRASVALLEFPPDIIEIPYDGISMPGYFFRVDDSGMSRPTIILTDGYDGTVEEIMICDGFAALERGYNVLAFDGPGQGAMIVDRGVVFRPDWEKVVTPVVDLALSLPEVDPDRLVLHGLSFGGYLAPRAATREHRFAACVSDCGPYDLSDALESHIPAMLLTPAMEPVLRRILAHRVPQASKGWALRRGQWVHGVGNSMDYLTLSKQYSLKGLERLITCPTLVVHGENDDISVGQRALFEALTCRKEYIEFASSEGAGAHCEAGARRQYHERVFAWLETVVGDPAQPARTKSVSS